ncbi:VWA domain-containing protein [Miltoncostaea marina]|uniref:VWA domain-containing protein n=1 Tax=Miltoncostaea marina TaxID=2843215 RepID=UPI001C3C7EE1|nr:VWA domain-containing protein [Miltoncostaea marina]
MFEGLFHALRARGVPVAMDEWLGLQDALARGLADSSLSRFYLLARALLVKSERHYDDYDLAFAEYLSGLEPADDAIADRVWEWLAGHPRPLEPTAEQRAALERAMSRVDLEALRRRLEERMREQREAHHGGSRHIGTGGTSPLGHGGWHPGGVRIGGAGRHRTAAQVAAERRFREHRTDETLGVREMGVALRRLRRLTSRLEGPATELDLEGTIDATADAGGSLRLVHRRPRRNAVRVVLLLDVGGSMDEHAALVDRLFSAVHGAARFRELTVRYFHNCVYDRLYETARMLPSRAEPTLELLARTTPAHKLVVVGDACMAPSELTMAGGAIDYGQRNDEPGWTWLGRLAGRFPARAWLNPVPRSWWAHVHGAPTLAAVASLFPMHELSVDGLDAAVDGLMAATPGAPRARAAG